MSASTVGFTVHFKAVDIEGQLWAVIATAPSDGYEGFTELTLARGSERHAMSVPDDEAQAYMEQASAEFHFTGWCGEGG